MSYAALRSQMDGLGRNIAAPAAAAVDRDARFPFEAFAALKAGKLLSCYVPRRRGGLGLSVVEVAELGEILGHHCGSSAMVFAMHQIQVACIVHHALGTPYFEDFLQGLVEHQWLLASATTETNIGGDVRTSICAVEREGDRFRLEKQAPVISYAEEADVILVTARRERDAGPNEQVHVLVKRGDVTLTPLSSWDTFGFRGTCSLGYVLRAEGPLSQILPVPYAQIHARTMHAFSHSVWSSLWLGIAEDAVSRARAFVRSQARKSPDKLPPTALRLAELDVALSSMRALVRQGVGAYQLRLDQAAEGGAPFAEDMGFTLQINNLKVRSSELLVSIVSDALLICGIAGYRNDSPYSLGRHLRDAWGAPLMVHNDRILGQSSMIQIMRGAS